MTTEAECTMIHMKRLLFVSTLLALTLACDLLNSTPTPEPGVFQTQVAQGVAATLKAAVTATATIVPTPPAIPTPGPPKSELYPDVVYTLQEERVFGNYTLRLWHNTNGAADTAFFDGIVTIWTPGELPIQIESVSGLGQQNGTDINCDGFPEVIVETYSGGAHCCFNTVAYTMTGTSIKKVLDTVPSNL